MRIALPVFGGICGLAKSTWQKGVGAVSGEAVTVGKGTPRGGADVAGVTG